MLKSPEELPEGVDLAVFTLPAAGVRDAVAACVKRKVGSAMIFAAGFAETGEQAMQDEVANTARNGGLAIVGPNCLGVTNNVDGMMLHMLFAREALRFGEGSKPGSPLSDKAAACSAISSARPMGAACRCPMSSRPATRSVSNRPTSSNFSPTIPRPVCWSIYTEQVRRPREFLDAIRRCRAAGKPVVLMFPGRSAKSKQAALSHTGALVGDYATMRTVVEDAGAIVVTTMDEMMDLAEILVRFPKPPVKGPASSRRRARSSA